MPSYKLTYFNTRGRAEVIRLLFAAVGVKYEDCRVDVEEFEKLKASGKLPYGQVPILEYDGKILAQTATILKYVGREIGLAPTDSFQLARAGMVVDGILDMMAKAVQFFLEKDEEKKKALAETFFGKTLPDSLAIHEKLVKANDGKHFAGNKMTFADIMFHTSLDSLFHDRKEDVPAALNNFPLLKDLFSRVLANPGIKEWLKKRPVTAI